MKRLRMFLWGVAERADWYGWWPRRFWRWMLYRFDRKAKLDKPLPPDPSCQSGPAKEGP